MSDIIAKVYGAASEAEQKAAYDAWSGSYERDLFAMGYRSFAMAAAVFARHVAPATTPILDAGCGSGLQGEVLASLGYGPLIGLDLSVGMLAAARAKGIYAELLQLPLGSGLGGIADARFGAAISVGTITPGHAPPTGLADLVRVTRPGGHLVFTLRDDAGMDPRYADACTRLATDGHWRHVFTSRSFPPLPHTEPRISSVVHVYRRL